jgi:hypothetical protein
MSNPVLLSLLILLVLGAGVIIGVLVSRRSNASAPTPPNSTVLGTPSVSPSLQTAMAPVEDPLWANHAVKAAESIAASALAGEWRKPMSDALGRKPRISFGSFFTSGDGQLSTAPLVDALRVAFASSNMVEVVADSGDLLAKGTAQRHRETEGRVTITRYVVEMELTDPQTRKVVSADFAKLRHPPLAVVPTSGDATPDWLNDPSDGGKYIGAYGVGATGQTVAAQAEAREEMLQVVQSKIQATCKDWLRVLNKSTRRPTEIGPVAEALYHAVSKEVASRMAVQATHATSDKVYVLLRLDQADVLRLVILLKTNLRDVAGKQMTFTDAQTMTTACSQFDGLVEREFGMTSR